VQGAVSETLMNKGPGRVEQIIEAVFAAEPDNAFTIEDLCDRVYPGELIEKKHRVSVLRAAKRVAKRRGEIDTITGEGLGGTLIFFDQYCVLSYAMARLKSSSYRTNDKRGSLRENEADLRAKIAPGGSDHELIVRGGAWWRHVEERIAKRDGDTDKVERLKAEGAAELAAMMQKFAKIL
jgi:hypothetical protein